LWINKHNKEKSILSEISLIKNSLTKIFTTTKAEINAIVFTQMLAPILKNDQCYEEKIKLDIRSMFSRYI
jgi:hypothetical protein